MDKVRIGIIGCGGIANNVHIPLLQKCSNVQITALCDIDEKALKRTADRLSVPEDHRFSDYKQLIACADVDAVEICTPNYLHVEMAKETAAAGKPMNVEKPLSVDLPSVKPLEEQLKVTNVPNMMCFSYRFQPAVRYAKWILEQNMLGDILSVNVEYLKSSAFMEGRRLDWRFVKKYAGTGVLGDLGVHLIDMTRFLTGEFKNVCARKGIVVKERKRLDSEELAPVETDDYCNFLADIGDGISGTFIITRCAIGNENHIKYDIFGTNGVLSFDLNHPEILNVCIGKIDAEGNGMHTVKVPKRFYITQEQMFVNLVRGYQTEYLPTLKDGIACQKILDALLLSSDENRWVSI